jgi:hypothetical protein
MAVGLKGWLGLVAGGMALIALAKLPPEPPSSAARREELPEQARLRELSREMRVIEGILLRRGLSDSLAPRVAAAGRGAVVVDVKDEAWVRSPGRRAPLTGDSARAAILAAVERALEGFPGPREAAIGVFLSPRRADAPVLQDTYMGSLSGTPYCFRVVTGSVVLGARTLSTTEGIDVLGPCRLSARYGLPGPHILSWLKGGGIAFAGAAFDDVRRPPPGPGAGSIAEYRGVAPSLAPDRCLAGVVEACATAFLEPRTSDAPATDEARVVAASPLIGGRGSKFLSVFGAGDDYLLSDLERAFGPRRFTLFWRSQADVRPAFEHAFATPVGRCPDSSSPPSRAGGVSTDESRIPGRARAGPAPGGSREHESEEPHDEPT